MQNIKSCFSTNLSNSSQHSNTILYPVSGTQQFEPKLPDLAQHQRLIVKSFLQHLLLGHEHCMYL